MGICLGRINGCSQWNIPPSSLSVRYLCNTIPTTHLPEFLLLSFLSRIQSVCLPACLLGWMFVCLFVYLPACQVKCLSASSPTVLPFCLYLPVCLNVYLPILQFYLSAGMLGRLSVCLFACLPGWMSVCCSPILSTYLSAWQFYLPGCLPG